MPRPVPGQPPLQVPPGVTLEFRNEDGKTFARIPPPPPPPGTRENPVEIVAPEHVNTGAAITAQPTPAQAEAGNYQKRHVSWNGLDIAVENEAAAYAPVYPRKVHPGRSRCSTPRIHQAYQGQRWRAGRRLSRPTPAIAGCLRRRPGGPADRRIRRAQGADRFYRRGSGSGGLSRRLFGESRSARLGALKKLTIEQFKDWLKSGALKRPSHTATL